MGGWNKNRLLLSLTVAVVTGLAANVWAQQSTLGFDAKPDERAFANNYPPAALENEQIGAVILCCRVRADRSLDCVVDREWPEGAGFGVASLAVAASLRVTASSVERSMAIGNPRQPFPLHWSLSPEDPEQSLARKRVTDSWREQPKCQSGLVAMNDAG